MTRHDLGIASWVAEVFVCLAMAGIFALCQHCRHRTSIELLPWSRTDVPKCWAMSLQDVLRRDKSEIRQVKIADVDCGMSTRRKDL